MTKSEIIEILREEMAVYTLPGNWSADERFAHEAYELLTELLPMLEEK